MYGDLSWKGDGLTKRGDFRGYESVWVIYFMLGMNFIYMKINVAEQMAKFRLIYIVDYWIKNKNTLCF